MVVSDTERKSGDCDDKRMGKSSVESLRGGKEKEDRRGKEKVVRDVVKKRRAELIW